MPDGPPNGDGARPASTRDRLKIQRHPTPERDPQDRRDDWNEAVLAYSDRIAIEEADRCILCKRAPCSENCPVGIDIAGFIGALQEGDLARSYAVLSETNALPAICGRVCAQEMACEKYCVLERKGTSVAIGNLERYVADWAREEKVNGKTRPTLSSGFKVAVVGSGPAGIAAAGDLAAAGHGVTVFEALHRAGGVLVYGIPEFRLPNEIVAYELSALEDLGVQIVTNAVIGRVASIEELLDEFDAVFLATGAGLPIFLGIEGESLVGVYSGNEFLMRVNLMRADLFPNYDTPVDLGGRVVVVGGGDTSMDCCRVALRMNADQVILLYRRSRELMPARSEEVDHALSEGVELLTYSAPTRFLGKDGIVTGVEVIELELGEPDESGRARPIPKPGTERVIECDTAIIAVGYGVNPTVTGTEPGLVTNKWGVVQVDEHGATSLPGVYAGGDLVTGGATVVAAMAQGRDAARSIDKYLASRASIG